MPRATWSYEYELIPNTDVPECTYGGQTAASVLMDYENKKSAFYKYLLNQLDEIWMKLDKDKDHSLDGMSEGLDTFKINVMAALKNGDQQLTEDMIQLREHVHARTDTALAACLKAEHAHTALMSQLKPEALIKANHVAENVLARMDRLEQHFSTLDEETSNVLETNRDLMVRLEASMARERDLEGKIIAMGGRLELLMMDEDEEEDQPLVAGDGITLDGKQKSPPDP